MLGSCQYRLLVAAALLLRLQEPALHFFQAEASLQPRCYENL